MLKMSPLKWNLLSSHFYCNAFREASFLWLTLPGCPGAGVEPQVTPLSPSGGEAKEKQPQTLPRTRAGGGEGAQQVNYSAFCDLKHRARECKRKPSHS